MAKGIHLFPYRTQKLSLSAPMVLGWRRPGRVGRCRIPNEKNSACAGFFSYSIVKVLLSGYLSQCATWYLVGTEARRRLWDRSRARPAGETARRSVGNCKERHRRDYAVPRGDEGGRSVGNLKERPKGATMRLPGDDPGEVDVARQAGIVLLHPLIGSVSVKGVLFYFISNVSKASSLISKPQSALNRMIKSLEFLC